MFVMSFAAALLGSADVRAEQPATRQEQHWSAEKILPPEPGRKACWRRVYDAKHLTAHPQQKVTELTFFLRVSGYDHTYGGQGKAAKRGSAGGFAVFAGRL
jgi:hypothetical protein